MRRRGVVSQASARWWFWMYITVPRGGIVASPTSGPLTTIVVENCLVSNNHFGILALPSGSGATIDVSQTMISENGVGLYNFGPSSITSFGNNRFARNGS